jgi:hypothetical protein
MRRTAITPLLNLAAAAILAQWSGVSSCGFTNALRMIESLESIKSCSTRATSLPKIS